MKKLKKYKGRLTLIGIHAHCPTITLDIWIYGKSYKKFLHNLLLQSIALANETNEYIKIYHPQGYTMSDGYWELTLLSPQADMPKRKINDSAILTEPMDVITNVFNWQSLLTKNI